MADNPQTLSAITSALAQTFPDEVKRQINRMAVLLGILRVVSSPSTAKNVAWDVEADGMVAENFAEGAAVANFGSDAITPAILSIGLYRANFRVTNLAAAAAARSQSPSQVRDLIGRNFYNGMSKLASTINPDAWTGAGTGTLLAGLTQVAIEDANTYAGIDRTAGGGVTNAFWKATKVDAAGTAISFAAIRSDLAAIYKKSGRRPDMAGTDPDTLNKVKALFDPNRRWDRDLITADRGTIRLDNNSDVVVVDGCQFFEDKDAPASTINYINSAEAEIEVLPQAMNFADPMGAADDGFNRLMLGFSAYELGRVGSDRRMSIEAQLQLKVLRPNAFGKRINIG